MVRLGRRASGRGKSGAPGARRHPAHVCIVSRKDLTNNTRVHRQAAALDAAGYRVTVVCPAPPAPGLRQRTPQVAYRTVPVFNTEAGGVSPAPSSQPGAASAPAAMRPSAVRRHFRAVWNAVVRPWNPLRTTFRYRRRVLGVMAGASVDLVQAHDAPALAAAAALARRCEAELLYDAVEITEYRLHSREDTPGGTQLAARLAAAYKTFPRSVANALDRRALRRCGRVIAVSEGVAQWYARHRGVSTPAVIRNCRDYHPWLEDHRLRRDCGLSDSARVVLWFGYTYPAQGIERLIEAAAHTPEHVHFLLLTMTMPRWEAFAESIHAAAAASPAAHRIFFRPARAPDDLVAYASGADIGIIPRPNVGPNVAYSLPNKFFEMVMARLPIAVSDVPDMRSLVERYDIGRVFDENDSTSVAETVSSMLDPTTLHTLKTNADTAAQELNWAVERRRYVSVIDACVSGSAYS